MASDEASRDEASRDDASRDEASHDEASLLRLLRAVLECDTANFRPGQLEAMTAVMRGRDCLSLLPTGAGKSLVYVLPAMLRAERNAPGVTVVVTPLLSLLADQLRRCDEMGVDAEAWSGATDPTRLERIERDLRAAAADDEGPTLTLLFTTPESLQTPRLRAALRVASDNGHVAALAVDEAHCVSQWGHDFRPAYLALKDDRDELLGGAPIQALTATATRATEASIAAALGLQRDHVVARSSLNRANLGHEVVRRECLGDGGGDGEERAAVDHVVAVSRAAKATAPESAGIVYARERGECERVAELLATAGMDVEVFHAGRSKESLRRALANWAGGDIDAVVATVAFGMGIDKPDVRWVAHWGPPTSLEGLYQESGRAGRDGKPSRCVLYADAGELDKIRKLDPGRAEKVDAYVRGTSCRRAALLSHFDEGAGGGARACDENDVPCDACADVGAVKRMNAAADRKSDRDAERKLDEMRAAAEAAAEEAMRGGGRESAAREPVAKLAAAKPAAAPPTGPRRIPAFRPPTRRAAAAGASAGVAAKRKFVCPMKKSADDPAKRR